MTRISALQSARASYKPKTPPAFTAGALVDVIEGIPTTAAGDAEKIEKLFPATYGNPEIIFQKSAQAKSGTPLNVGVILSGGQAPGGHNVIAGIYDGVKSIHQGSKVFGFLKGPDGLIKNQLIELTGDIIDAHRNTGGFDMIGSGRTKLEQEEHFIAAQKHCEANGISTLVIIGGDDSNTNACLLAEYFKSRKIAINVIGCPKTIDGDLKNSCIETSFGFDTACRVYSELIGNIERDANSAKKYWHFIKLMGRSASHICLECALQTQPNITIISEEVAAKKMTLSQIVEYMAGIIAARAANGMNFGVALIPEGLIEFIPEVKNLISSLNDLLAREADAFQKITDSNEKVDFVKGKLDGENGKVFNSLPGGIQLQLCLDRDPHGNVQVSLIETEKMLAEMVGKRLKSMDNFKGKFSTQTHFFGYEGRCAAPSNYDADYCYSLGFTAAALANAGRTGYMAVVRNTIKPASEWTAGGVPITMMMNVERRHGEDKPVIRKALTELDGAPFKFFSQNREKWAIETEYVYPGPIQYFGPSEVCDLVSKTLELEQKSN
ncbi:MAG: diphosphate--fructose-6-phosphate 1-phosphotransferase [Lentisphaerae bacterium]|nr:diphosphate--fructose-6-phosphate 1-phosphotransferase [Victivallaceae bacterium]MDD3117482.1 diphosphate--fructose-6-phosphate 1-phosphotransferase [Victivallaceae bacterium]MDD3704173.1 diphosphate--fructose-6-phosphate 1-phosphotransferase [Victivallaceae bacterium]NLK83680.1 diphosphate--fructose-6-phosphate 1-phosphotransferase [Lentisphaerota bacterium]